MSTFLSQILAFFMSIMYFFGSFGFGANDPVTINISDANNQPVCESDVYYVVHGKNETIDYIPIGTTDIDGNVQWENQQYGEQTIAFTTDNEVEFPFNCMTTTVNISRTKNETVFIQLDIQA